MNDPWSNLIDTLAGNERKTPVTWPSRNVHRIMDDSLMADPQQRPVRAVRPLAPTPVRLAPMAAPRRVDAPPVRLRCPCTNCVAERAMRTAA